MKPFKTNFYMSLVSAVMVFVLSLATGTFVLFHSIRGWAAAFGFSFMLIVVACVLFPLGIAMTGAQKTAILSTFEPLTSIVPVSYTHLDVYKRQPQTLPASGKNSAISR